MNYVYILECSDGSYYTGWTNNIEKRVNEHNNGTGAKYTRGRGPVKLIYIEKFEMKTDAMKREWQIKQLDRKKKNDLVENFKDEILL